MKDLVEAISIPALLINPEARIEASNGDARTMFGERIEGRHYIGALRQPPLLDAIELALATGAPTRAAYLASDARGDVTYQAVITPMADHGAGHPLLLCFEDHTAKQEAGQMRRDFVANVSHELRTPLTAVLGFIETLRGAARNDPDARDRFLSIMEAEASRMNRLVSDLLSLSRVESEGRMRPTTLVQLTPVVQSVKSTLATLIEEQGTELQLIGLDEGYAVPADADQLGQVVSNLLENAIKYSGRDKRVTLRLSFQEAHPMIRGDAVLLSVEDEGDGIDPVHIPRLTERFYRIDSHRSRELGGTGLGLAIVKHIVNRHRGRLQIDSEIGKGSVFTVILPVEV
ncbi:MAG: ATP-binding protein [Silicimonas sp.]|nr:ATP-binding protein [Silicimonas sp.]